jgi:purine-binding chemotaxis protein CheW
MSIKQLILFKVGSETFGVEIGLVKEIVPYQIVPYQDVTPVPDSYDFVEGILNLRGKIATIIDMRKRLHAPALLREKTTRIIILDLDGKLMGIIVDAASEIIRVTPEQIGPPPELINEAGSGYITGIVRVGERLVVLLDLRRVLSPEEVGKLDDLISVLYGQAS